MHIARRKAELERIEKDNIKIAKKIFLIEPAFKASELRDFYKHQEMVSTNLNKIKRDVLPNIGSARQINPDTGKEKKKMVRKKRSSVSHRRSTLN